MNLGVVGNGTFGAITDRRGRIVWCCLDGFAGDPIFNSFLNNDSDHGGWFDISIEGLLRTEQKYIPQTAILITTLISKSNDVLQIKDFAPRFVQHDRMFRPFQLFRTITRIRGDPIAIIRIRPSFEYNSAEGYQTRGSHHVRYCGPNGTLRLTTNAPIQLVIEEAPFLVHEPVYLVFGPDESFAQPLTQVAKEYEDRTIKFWKHWNSMCVLPVDYQEILARSAISLQLLHSDEVGGFVTGLSFLASGQDARVFELVDVCVSISTLREFGQFGQIRKFLEFLKSIAFQHTHPQSVYDYLGGVGDLGTDLVCLAGGLRTGIPTCSIDVGMYGLAIIALSHGFFDIRLKDVCSPKLFEKLEIWGECAVLAFREMLRAHTLGWPGSGSWGSLECMGESGSGPSTMGSILVWAAADKLGRIAQHCHWMDKSKYWQAHAVLIRNEILQVATIGGALTAQWGGTETGPSLLRAVEVGFVNKADPVWLATVESFEKKFTVNGDVSTSTLLWYAEALRSSGREDEAKNLFHAICAVSNECGLIAENINLETMKMSGNIPHTPTLLGMLRIGSRLGRNWRGI